MGYGGPVWHASAGPILERLTRDQAAAVAVRALSGAGDKLQEWHEWTGYAFHLRRRLTKTEQESIGDAIDCRGTKEGILRLNAIIDVIPPMAVELAMQELGATEPLSG
jgi:hypothetical protein